MKHTVILFYTFTEIEDPKKLMIAQKELCANLGLTGRMLIAREGINATFEGTEDAIETYCKEFAKDKRFSEVPIKRSEGTGSSFPKLKIKVRDEIVTLGVGYIDPKTPGAPHVTAGELDAMYERGEEFYVLDLRNDYEIASGAFENTIDLGLRNFRDLPDRLAKLEKYKDKKLVAVCTGGIRVDKATKYLTHKGFENVLQLEDGIHTYMKEFPGKHFKGTLFVFDNRMVTDVTDIKTKEIVGKCKYCDTPSERYYSDDSQRPSVKVICCTGCYEAHKYELREAVSV